MSSVVSKNKLLKVYVLVPVRNGSYYTVCKDQNDEWVINEMPAIGVDIHSWRFASREDAENTLLTDPFFVTGNNVWEYWQILEVYLGVGVADSVVLDTSI